MKNQSIATVARSYGYEVEIDRHGRYTNYLCTSPKGLVTVELDTVPSHHHKWAVLSDYRLTLPTPYTHFEHRNGYFTVVDSHNTSEFPQLPFETVCEILKNNI